jgi:hypothetical protein
LQYTDISCYDILRKIHLCILNTISISLDSLLEASIQDMVNDDTSLFVVSKQNAASFGGTILRVLEKKNSYHTSFIPAVRLSFEHWFCMQITPFTWFIYRAHCKCEQSTENVCSSTAFDPTSDISLPSCISSAFMKLITVYSHFIIERKSVCLRTHVSVEILLSIPYPALDLSDVFKLSSLQNAGNKLHTQPLYHLYE